MKENLQKIIFKVSSNVLFVSFLLISVLAAVFYIFLGRPAERALVEQMLHRTQANVRVGASSIMSFFELTGKFVVVFSNHDDIVTPSSRTDSLLETTLSQWENTPVTSIVLVNEDGIVTNAAYSDVQGKTGISVAEREYFIWAKQADDSEYYVSPAIKSKLRESDYSVSPIVSPIVDGQGNFKGALVFGVSVDRLTMQFMDHLRISDESEIYLVKSDGSFLYSPHPELLGTTMFSFIEEHPFLGSEVLVGMLGKLIENSTEGKIEIAYPQEVGTKSPLKTRLLAYSPIRLGNEKWLLVIATPKDDALISLSRIYFNQAAILLVIFLITLSIFIKISRMKGYIEGVEKEHKMHGIKSEDKG